MNRKIVILACALVALLTAGCASGVIGAASTKLQVTDANGKSLSFTFPKELDAKKFDLSVNPNTGVISLKSDQITTSSQGVIDSAGKAQAQAMSDMSKSLNTVVSTVLPLVAPAAAPFLRSPARAEAADDSATE